VEIAVERGPPTQVAAFSVGPNAGLPAEEIAAALRTRLGGVLDLDALAEDVQVVRGLLRKADFLRARVGSPAVSYQGAAATVAIPVEAGPRISFHFAGSQSFSGAELREHLGYDPELPLDAAAVEASAERLRAFLQQRGFARARVAPEEIGEGAQVAVLFHVDEGRRYRLGEVRFQGQSFRDEAWLRRSLREALGEEARAEPAAGRAKLDYLATAGGASPDKFPLRPEPLDRAEVYDEPTWGKAMSRIVEGYRKEGFLDAAGDSTRLTLDALRGVVDVEIWVREGVRTFVESISFEGNEKVPLPDLRRQSRLAPGDPLSLARVEETRQALLDLYAKRGYLYARVESVPEYAPGRGEVAIRYRVDEGPLVQVANVLVTGNRRTREDVIRRAIEIQPGDVYSPEAAAASQAGLLRLGVFRSAGLRLSDPDVPEPQKDLTVEVSERPWQTLVTGIGLSSADGPRAFLEYGRPNLFGRALELAGRAKVNYPLAFFRPDLVGRPIRLPVEGTADLGLRYPRVFNLPFIGARIDLIAERRIQSAYDLSRAALSAGLDLARFGRFSASLTYDLEVDDVALYTAPVFNLAQAEEARLLFPKGLTTLHSLRPVVSLDFRDNAAHPTRGWLASASADLSHSLGDGSQRALFGILPGSQQHINMAKLLYTLTGYVPLGTQSVFALSVRGGRVFPLDPQSVTIAPKRFYLGGAASMRGYGESEMIPEDRRLATADQTRRCGTVLAGVGCPPELAQRIARGVMLPSEGGEAFALVKAELRFPLTQSVEMGVFADVGNLWLDAAQVALRDLRLNAGFGLRLLTPVGPAVLDLGFNVNPDSRLNETILAPHFSIGFF
jgi:outer membrane protein assembly factor BamA